MKRLSLLGLAVLCATLLAAPRSPPRPSTGRSATWTPPRIGARSPASSCPRPSTRPPAASSRSPSIPRSRCSRARTRSTPSPRTSPRSIAWQASTSPAKRRSLELMDLPLFVPWDYDFRVKVWDARHAAVPRLPQEEVRRLSRRHPAGRAAHDLRQGRDQGSRRSKGRKIRSAGPTETEFTRALGMTPVSVAPSEIYTGLQQGLLDGNWVADAPHFFNKGYEVTKFIFDVGSAGAGFFVMVNEKALEALPADSQEGADGCAPGLCRRAAQGHQGRRHQRPADG